MKCSHTLSSLPETTSPLSLAIGTFDGVHLGHQALINEMKKYGKCLIFTFSNHPSHILQDKDQTPTLIQPLLKKQYLEEAGVDYCVIQDFSKEISEMPYQLFLEEIYQMTPFSHLFFGENDALGKDRKGTPENIKQLGLELGYTAHYLPKVIIDGLTVSSTNIRRFLKEGKLDQAKRFLGRPYAAHIHRDDPYIEESLLKEGTYNVSLAKSPTKNTKILINHNGNIEFLDKAILSLMRETETLIFNSGINHV